MTEVQDTYAPVNIDFSDLVLRHRAKHGRGRLAIADMRMLTAAPLPGWGP